MADISLLIIEDDQTQIDAYLDVIELFNKKIEDKFIPTICNDFESGSTAIKSPLFDAAIIDLKLSASDRLEGRDLVESIYQKIRIPVFIYSGSLSQIDDIQENALLRKIVRTESLNDILKEIIKIYKTGLTRFLRPNGEIDQKLTEIFWQNLSTDIGAWIGHNNPNALLRYIFSHFYESFDVNLDGDFEVYNPIEVYIKPPIKPNIHTGDLINYEGQPYIVLNPSCDIVYNYKKVGEDKVEKVRKAEKMMLILAKEFDYKTLCLNKKTGTVDKGKITEFVNNSSFRFHYLPPLDGNNGFLIDFQQIKTVDFTEKNDRICSISAPFIKDIISRFSNYYSRQGQPTFGQENIVKRLFEAV